MLSFFILSRTNLGEYKSQARKVKSVNMIKLFVLLSPSYLHSRVVNIKVFDETVFKLEQLKFKMQFQKHVNDKV